MTRPPSSRLPPARAAIVAAILAACVVALGADLLRPAVAVHPEVPAAAPAEDPAAAPAAAPAEAPAAAPSPAEAAGMAAAATAPRRPGALFYFFSPDWRPPDLGRLTVAIEDVLSAQGVAVSFQAFARYEDFERQADEMPPAFAIAPGWLAAPQTLAPGRCQTVLAHPIRRGKTTYRKALMTKPGIDSIDDLARGSIAATLYSMSSGESSAVLGAFHLADDSAKVVPVPKDVDALLALSFGQVDAALVTSEQYEQLARTRPAEAERLRVLAFSPEIRLPQVFACGDSDPLLRQKFRDALVALAGAPAGRPVLEQLGFDRFVAGAPPVAPAPPLLADQPSPARKPQVAKPSSSKKSTAKSAPRSKPPRSKAASQGTTRRKP